MRIATCAVVVMFVGAAFAADDKPATREIATKELKIVFPERGGKATEPTELKSADDLAKSAALKGAADEIKKQVNFDKEKLVFFAWQGSGGDTLSADEKTAGTFSLVRGKTKDLRQHLHLFVVPKDAVVKVVTGK